MKVILQPPTEDQRDRIRKELKEDPERFQNNLKLLETWISCQNHLPQNYDRNLLISFLRGCKQDMEYAKKKFEYYFICKTTATELFSNRVLTNDHDLKASFCTSIIPLAELTPEGYRTSVCRLTDPDVSSFVMQECLRYILLLCDYRLHKDTMCCGEIFIFDSDKFSPAHAAKFITNHLKIMLDIIQNAYPFRIKQIHIVTNHLYIEKLVSVVKQFLKEKLQKRIHIHRSVETLYKFVPQDILPSNYGGKKESLDELNEEWRELLIENSKWFEEFENARINGPIPKNLSASYSIEDFGVEGSFRQLAID